MAVGRTNWTTDELAAMLRCHRSHTTARLDQFTKTFAAMLPDTSTRSDRLAEKFLSFLRTGGRLANADPKGLRRYLADLAESGSRPR